MTRYISSIRPPAVPLVTVDPYFSIWSMADKLTGDTTRHWTGKPNSMYGLVRIDGRTLRFLGTTYYNFSEMEQKRLEVYPTRTIYTFQAAGIELKAAFMTPLLTDDLDIMSRSASYIEVSAKSIDGKEHQVEIYLDILGELVVNNDPQKIIWGSRKFGDDKLQVLFMGSLEQPVLGKSGDDLRIDWGYLYFVTPGGDGSTSAILPADDVRKAFAETGVTPGKDSFVMPQPASSGIAMASSMSLGAVGDEPVLRLITLVYDDQFAIEYFHRRLKAYWRRNGMGIDELIRQAIWEYPELKTRCESFDKELLSDALAAGGEDYADIVTLGYRQAIAAHKLVADIDGRALFFSKENFSNGCIATVDVTYPAMPMYVLFNTELLKATLEPILEYAESWMWPHPFAPHDVGTYPLANGQVYGGGADQANHQMPVEESGNMLIMLGVLSYREGNADYAAKHWDTISTWADYLKEKGLDPENQLCTDDFAGHLAHNTNLSIKAIMGLACYSLIAEMLSKTDIAAKYRKTAENMAAKWKEMAFDGEHYRLAFDQPGTWSMKYNLVWDKILGLNIFDPAITETEVESYKKRINPYGLPLDNRKEYTKGDWLAWTATLADSEEDFKIFIAPLRKFLNESPSRVPFSDWHWTTDGKQVEFRARSVVGGIFIKMLTDKSLWDKWSKREKIRSTD